MRKVWVQNVSQIDYATHVESQAILLIAAQCLKEVIEWEVDPENPLLEIQAILVTLEVVIEEAI
jgi:hypothetical protein